jgi:hypothetical protein
MIIAIPSKGRKRAQSTVANLPRSYRQKIRLVVPEDEVGGYQGVTTNVGIQILGCPAEGIGATRQWILETLRKEDPKICMMDDDLVFCTRRKDDPTKFIPAKTSHVIEMLMELEAKLETFAHASIATRQGGNRNTEDLLTNTRMLRILSYNMDNINIPLDYGRLEVMEDFDVTLSLLRSGHPNVVLNKWVQDQKMSNAAGGCSTYRDAEMQARSAEKLAELHAPFVRVVTKKTKDGWFGGERKDVVVQWKRAFASSQG